MSLERTVGEGINYGRGAFSRFMLAGILGSTLSALPSCGKQEGENVQRYVCMMTACVPDSKGPYAVADCNNECGMGNDGNGQQENYLTVTRDGTPVCPLGWGRKLDAGIVEGTQLYVNGACGCDEGAAILLTFGPTPPLGGSAPCTRLQYITQGGYEEQCASTSTGTGIVSGTTGSYRLSGNCSCGSYSASFSLPLHDSPWFPSVCQ